MSNAASPARWTRWFTDRPLGLKIGAVLALLVVVVAGTNVLSISRMRDMNAVQEEIYTENLRPLNDLAAMQRAVAAYRSRVLQYPVYTPADRPAITEQAAEKLADLKAAVDSYTPYIIDQAAAATFETEFQKLVEINETQMIPAADAGDLEGFGRLYKDVAAPVVSDFSQALEDEGIAQSTQAQARNAEAAAAADQAVVLVVTTALIGVLLAAGLGVFMIRRLLSTVRSVQATVEAMATGDLTVVPEVRDADEIGQMAASLAAAQVALRSVMASVVASSDAVAAASEELSATSAQISSSAQETSAQSGVVSAAAEEVSRNVATVAAGAEQMGASIREISQNANEAARVAAQAVAEAETTNATVVKLGDSSREIGNVVKVITSIAEQTNLLALNATIEAARAGEAGKGFAVVANEVKELAQATARATEDITRRVETIQGDTSGAVTAIGRISEIIGSINDFQLTIASAVEEQTATTNEMSRSVQEAAGGSTEIAMNITGVSTAASSTTQALGQTQQAVDELSRMASDLRTTVARFTY
ncbi:methyl-accepting chemotaxis protein [Modestobacter muralis]|uniref:Methyl-accepting chemotaxis protein n=1 Tax=Modestobacter muralis TaxID=1608614 RepID=A0A6P0H499_9ACTN|nr:methyl-accepting chemotaxis protein [Modestobacter muralis]NEK93704.1 methyl-accepting chemotaxis protein [Modestobacter muralis]NEN50471.1 methyl-accepting chemotaxis protein [Modestobacter muralis]